MSAASSTGLAPSRLAVLIPVHNDIEGLQRTLASLIHQSVPLTVVIVDDGSDPPVTIDATCYPFPIVVLRQRTNAGIETALNVGLDYILRAGFEYVARLDAGDECTPDRLASQQAFLDAHREISLVGSDVEWRRDDGSVAFVRRFPTTHEEIDRALHHTVCLIHPAVMFRAEIISAVGGYSCDYPAAEDYEFFWRIAKYSRVANIPRVLLVTRFNPAGVSMRRRRQQLRSRLSIQLRFFCFTEPFSYIGLAKTLALMCVPYSLVLRLKHRLSLRGFVGGHRATVS
jgi:glycosyltransferase involved in cell wall biosynthesis